MNPRCQSHLSPAASTVLAAAFRRANSVNIGGEHLFLSVLEVDPGLIAKFKIDGFRPAALIGQMRSAAKTLEPRDPAMVFEILHLASRIALNIPVNNQHVLLASILEPASLVSTYIAQSGIDVTDLLQRKFYFMPRALELWSDPASVSDQAKCSYNENPHAVLSELFAKLVPPEPAVPPKSVRQIGPLPPLDDPVPNPERRAREWLQELIPEQAELYASKKYIEVPSTLHPGRHYRIFGENRRTLMFEDGENIGACCIHTREPSIPLTDRVIGEYFFIRGDEDAYLRIANVTRMH